MTVFRHPDENSPAISRHFQEKCPIKEEVNLTYSQSIVQFHQY